MFFFLPIGVEDHTVDRLPWVSICIAGLCSVVFLFTWVLPASPQPERAPLQHLVRYWYDHPYLHAPAELEQLAIPLPPRLRERDFDAAEIPPAADVIADQQRQLDSLAVDYREAADRNPLRRFGLVPARGLGQIGWLTYMFLHQGWLHLLGNMLFFYLVGPLLEDAWGRPLFAGFYLVGGLVAAAAQASLNHASTVYVIGASGAIAACMGAFTYRFARRKIRMAYFVWVVTILRGTFKMPAWLWGLAWFASQYFDLALGGQSNVALVAHLGGFGFGFAVALLFGVTRLEANVIAPAVAHEVQWEQDPAIGRAQEALAHNDLEAADREYRQLLQAQPGQRDAELGLARLAAQRGDRSTAAAHIARALGPLLTTAPDTAWQLVDSLGADFHAEDLPHALAFRLGVAMQSAPDGLRPVREQLFLAAATAGGALGAKALLHAAELGVATHEDPATTRATLERARALGALPDELQHRLDALERLLPPPIDRSVPEEPLPAPPPQLLRCRLVAIGVHELELSGADGAIERLPLTAIQGLAVGIVGFEAPPGGRPTRLLVIDLVTAWGGGDSAPAARRLTSDTLAPQRFYPTLPPKQGFSELLNAIATASGATVLPDAGAVLHGSYQTFADLAAFEAAIYSEV